MSRVSKLAWFAVLTMFVGSAAAQNPARALLDQFEVSVRPVLTKHCIECHGEKKQEGGLNLSTRESLLHGGESGPAVVVGKPDESLIIEALRYESLEMPPSGQLDPQIVESLSRWIQAGAVWPTGTTLKQSPKITSADKDWWCYQSIQDPEPPTTDGDSNWSRNEIDQFVLRRLNEAKLTPSGEASSLTLARRIHFTLTGLPPDAATIQQASSPDFDVAALIDRLLKSSSYGENQARFWLDLVRYADSDGYRADHARPEAFRYRDYVIQSFNNDKPYDRFIREQIAGDEIDPGNRDAIIATMYLRHWIYEHNQRDVETQWHEILSDITETTADVFLAQGLKCARCHDHKFDPLLQKDYFRIKAFFAAFQPSENHPVATADARAEYQKELDGWERETDAIRKRLREIEHPVLLKHATREGFDKFIPKIKAMIRKHPADRLPYEQQIASMAERQFDLPYDKINDWLTDEQKTERDTLKKRLAEFAKRKPKPLPTLKFVGSDVGPTAPPTFIPDDKQHEEIAPGYLTLLDSAEAEILPAPPALRSTGRRTTLANWIASPQNPLTARVIVNRVWQQHFGKGIVSTSSDFGHLGTKPTHPELLDWLASRFIEDGWSLKKLHKRILMSATYQQSSRRVANQRIRETDPANDLLWRMNPRRLSGEEIMDAMLTASGELENQKRAIYQTVRRNTPTPILALFDSPDRIRSSGRRHRTTTPTQALLLNNSEWTHARAAAIAKRYPASELIAKTYVDLFGRPPSQSEEVLVKQFIAEFQQQTPEEKVAKFKPLAKMPKTDAQALNLKPDGTIDVRIANSEALPDGDFAISANVLLRSLYKDATVRTVVAHWNSNTKSRGWSLGVTSTKSRYKPLNVILQLVGNQNGGDKPHYEVIASDLRIELNKPYFIGARVDLDDTTESGITFYVKDLSTVDAKMQTAKVKHTVTSGIRPAHELTIGQRFGKHAWDGLIDRIQIEASARDLSKLAQADSPEGLQQHVVDLQFESAENLGQDSSAKMNHASAKIKQDMPITPLQRARIAFVHALLNSNEMIYVD